MTTTFLVDTNILLQFRNLKDIPWQDIVSDNHIKILIPRPVQQEIDQLKNDGNSRRAKKARAANSLMHEIIGCDNYTMKISQKDRLLEFSFPPDYKLNELKNVGEWLDIERFDHEIIATVMLYNNSNTSENIFLLTNDTAMSLIAKRNSIPIINPPEDWQLPPEQDEKDKTINELYRKIRTYEQRQPLIEIIPENLDENTITVDSIEPIKQQEVQEVIAFFLEMHPIVQSFPKGEEDLTVFQRIQGCKGDKWGHPKQYFPPVEKEISDYLEVQYPKWIEELKSWIYTAQEVIGKINRYIPLCFKITNSGNVPLISAVVEFVIYGGPKICPPEHAEKLDEILKYPVIPKPPIAPRGVWKKTTTSIFDSMASLANASNAFGQLVINTSPTVNPSFPLIHNVPTNRSKHSFYWKNGRPSTFSDHWVFECEEFRHKVDAETFEFYLYIPPEFSLSGFSLHCRVTGSNLLDPQTYHKKFKVQFNSNRAIDSIIQFASDQRGSVET